MEDGQSFTSWPRPHSEQPCQPQQRFISYREPMLLNVQIRLLRTALLKVLVAFSSLILLFNPDQV